MFCRDDDQDDFAEINDSFATPGLGVVFYGMVQSERKRGKERSLQGKRKAFRGICILLVLAGMIQAGVVCCNSIRHRQQQEALTCEGGVAGTAPKGKNNAGDRGIRISVISGIKRMTGEDLHPGKNRLHILGRYAVLYEDNSDLIGWLSIEGMDIDYPVMQCGNNEYYLNHSFYREVDKHGTLYIKDMADVNTPGTNIIIYGHNMRDGSMFGSLDKYRDAGFGKEHSVISFDTLYEERTYEIMAVFLSRVFYREEEGFRYYEFYQAENEEEFEYFYNNVKTMALYDTGVEAGYGDTFITLTTCSYHVEDGRLVIVARRMTDSR